ncbi:hypothetical protein FB639_005109, partial [Coemansia asiatica]
MHSMRITFGVAALAAAVAANGYSVASPSDVYTFQPPAYSAVPPVPDYTTTQVVEYTTSSEVPPVASYTTSEVPPAPEYTSSSVE